jgi:hypothetical protein
MKSFTCHCKEGKHEVDIGKPVWRYFDRMVTESGENINVALIHTGKVYSVPRIFIAAHGLAAEDLPHLGFEEVKP